MADWCVSASIHLKIAMVKQFFQGSGAIKGDFEYSYNKGGDAECERNCDIIRHARSAKLRAAQKSGE